MSSEEILPVEQARELVSEFLDFARYLRNPPATSLDENRQVSVRMFLAVASSLAAEKTVKALDSAHLVDRIATALANEIAMRKGAPPIRNCLSLMPNEMAQRFRDDARVAINVIRETL